MNKKMTHPNAKRNNAWAIFMLLFTITFLGLSLDGHAGRRNRIPEKNLPMTHSEKLKRLFVVNQDGVDEYPTDSILIAIERNIQDVNAVIPRLRAVTLHNTESETREKLSDYKKSGKLLKEMQRATTIFEIKVVEYLKKCEKAEDTVAKGNPAPKDYFKELSTLSSSASKSYKSLVESVKDLASIAARLEDPHINSLVEQVSSEVQILGRVVDFCQGKETKMTDNQRKSLPLTETIYRGGEKGPLTAAKKQVSMGFLR